MQTEISVKEVERFCASELKKAGYKTIAGGLAHCRISEWVYGWVGLSMAKRGGAVTIHPNIGVHCAPIMRSLDEIRGRKYQSGRLATCSVPLGFILPDEPQIYISETSEMDSEVGRMISYIKGPGEQYMRQLADLAVLEQSLLQRVGQLGGYPECYAFLLLLGNRREEFADFSAKQLALYMSQGDDDQISEWKSFQLHADRYLQIALQA